MKSKFPPSVMRGVGTIPDPPQTVGSFRFLSESRFFNQFFPPQLIKILVKAFCFPKELRRVKCHTEWGVTQLSSGSHPPPQSSILSPQSLPIDARGGAPTPPMPPALSATNHRCRSVGRLTMSWAVGGRRCAFLKAPMWDPDGFPWGQCLG